MPNSTSFRIVTDEDFVLLYRETGLQSMRLTGRCTNGFERDGGKLVHLASGQTGPALCGQRDGRTSNGWEISEQEVSCKRCLSRLPRALSSAEHLRANREASS